jgi:hypothetical protein
MNGRFTATCQSMAVARHNTQRHPKSSGEATGLANPKHRFQHGIAENKDGTMGVVTLGLFVTPCFSQKNKTLEIIYLNK